MGADPYQYFRIEGPELLEQLTQGARRLERGERAKDVVPTMMRHAHTLKGAARVVKCLDIAKGAHRVEDLLAPHREGEGLSGDAAMLSAVWTILDDISKELTELSGAQPTDSTAKETPALPEPEALRTLRAAVTDVDELTTALGEAISEHAAFVAKLDRLEAVRRSADLLARQLNAGRRATVASADWWSGVADRADRLTQMVRDLEVALESAGARVENELHGIAQRLQTLRFVPVDSIFSFLERTVRDAARHLGKDVALHLDGGHERIDADVLELVRGALLHLVRNGVVHGIETPARRVTTGKDAQGRIVVSVTRRADQLTFSCKDDGAGVDLNATRMRLGLPASTKDADVLRALLRGGASTASELSGLSGRGVGLDVAADLAERLGGSVELNNQPGSGFEVVLVVPSRLRMLSAMDATTGKLTATLPLSKIRRVALLSASQKAQSYGGTVVLDGEVVRAISLGRALSTKASAEEHVALIVDSQQGDLALLCEHVGQVRQTLLRPLPKFAPCDAAVMGLVLDSIGRPQMVLDPSQLGSVDSADTRRPLGHRRARVVLVIDDSLTTRMLEQSILEAHGYVVELATSAEEGLEKASERAFDLFLVDVEMPGMNGFEFVRRTRAHEKLSKVPAILVSSRSSESDFAMGIAAGAKGYVVKHQFDQGEFLTLVDRLAGAA